MKKILSAVLISSLIISSASFAAETPVKTNATIPASTAEANQLLNLKLNPPKNANEDFSQTFLHTAKNLSPYTFDLKVEDFATQKWAKYVSAVYVQSTDVSYYVSIIYADGSLKQVIALNTQAVERILEKTKTMNETLRKETLANPKSLYMANYRLIYQAPWQLVDEKSLITAKEMNSKNLSAVYADIPGALVNDYKVYKKGDQYILMVSVIPSGTWNSTVSASPVDLDTIIGKIIDNNTKLLKAIK